MKSKKGKTPLLPELSDGITPNPRGRDTMTGTQLLKKFGRAPIRLECIPANHNFVPYGPGAPVQRVYCTRCGAMKMLPL